ncbi:MAG: peptidoglycan DD-metalloendopeptidase family protein [Lachnospiraceae bacterium]|nr:peptidoglycan DD-metalloendopeptidase family protein [Lachnospiraceae bacterium]
MGKSRNKQKSYLTIGVITLAAVIVLAGISYRQSAEDEADEQEAVNMAESDWTETDENSGADTDGSEDGGDMDLAETDTDGSENGSAGNGSENKTEGTGSEDTSGDGALSLADADASGTGRSAGSVQETTVIEGTTEDVVAAMAAGSSLSFSESDVLRWPVQGDILINYSMDESVYFATLDQYKYNPALVIRGDVNAQVTAAAAGQVVGIEATAETGETVTMDIGNDYQLTYGQLKDLQVAEGDIVEAGELVGYISEPTKYYSVEGSNLYFAMTKNADPVNPLNYLE